MSTRSAIRIWGSVAITGALLLGACGGDDDDAAPTDTADTAEVLGPLDEATGSVVKLGVIADGSSEGINNEIDVQAAEATVKWMNAHKAGLGGHEVELEVCVTNADAGKAIDCANEMITKGVAAVAVPNSTQSDSLWGPLNKAGVPVMFYGITSPALLGAANTYSLTSPLGLLVDFPAGVAKTKEVTDVTAVVIDVPTAVEAFKHGVPELYKAQGLDLEVVTVPPGTADMTPQMQQVVSDNPDGVVTVVGNDSFCSAAFNGLRTAGFEGTVAAIPECITDATRTAVPSEFIKGMELGALTPFADKEHPDTEQYLAIMAEYGDDDADLQNQNGMVAFITVSSLITAASGVDGDVTPTSVAAAIASMPETVMLGTGGQRFRCDGTADVAGPAICSTRSVLSSPLDADGNPTKFTKLG